MKKRSLIHYLSMLLFLSLGVSEQISAQTIETEDFESYRPGFFPDSLWRDVRDISIPVTAPNPSAIVLQTTAWDSTITKAMSVFRTVSTSCGIFRQMDTSEIYHLSADIRIDQWSNASQAFFAEWAIAVGIFSLRPGWDFNGTPQITFVAQPVAENWVLYALRSDTSPSNFFNLEYKDSKVKLDTWYRVDFVLDDRTGVVHTKVVEKVSGLVVHEAMTAVPGWNPGKSGNYTYYGFWDGEYGSNATIGNQATVDNIRFSNDLSTSTETPVGAEARLRVFPNPSASEIFIEFDWTKQGMVEFQLLDYTGKVVGKQKVSGSGLWRQAVDSLPAGNYFIRAYSNERLLQPAVPFSKI